MGDDDVLKYWIQPEIVFGVKTGDTPVIFEGGRGTKKKKKKKGEKIVMAKDF